MGTMKGTHYARRWFGCKASTKGVMNNHDRVKSKIVFQLGAQIRGCEPEVMKTVGWPWPWPFEVRSGSGDQVVAVCLDYDAAMGAARDWETTT